MWRDFVYPILRYFIKNDFNRNYIGCYKIRDTPLKMIHLLFRPQFLKHADPVTIGI